MKLRTILTHVTGLLLAIALGLLGHDLPRAGEVPTAAVGPLPAHYRTHAWNLDWAARSSIGSAPGPGAQQGYAQAQSIRNGQAEYSLDGREWKELTIGLRLSSGAMVRTDTNAFVDLFLKHNGPVVRVTPDTLLILKKLYFETSDQETVIQTLLYLPQGRILGAVKKLSAFSTYEVLTPEDTVGIRGTQYDVSANGRIEVFEGAVLRQGPHGLELIRPRRALSAVERKALFDDPIVADRP